MTEQECKNAVLKHCNEAELEQWLTRNPIPAKWKGGPYSWAYTEMAVGGIFTWWRRNFLGYKI